ncbi:hypothetical protein RHSIM_Rhsim05G0030900 [Rhododendron simsii]|uniref:Uncharacterized protein n=1 Tax=Rhododendron simsii TaxID=118357 RepID=A0A834H2M5_RHOSS|nr:hypothetical protein RHSIM_Rhsim05G0030900 [Rhododendron simsii]
MNFPLAYEGYDSNVFFHVCVEGKRQIRVKDGRKERICSKVVPQPCKKDICIAECLKNCLGSVHMFGCRGYCGKTAQTFQVQPASFKLVVQWPTSFCNDVKLTKLCSKSKPLPNGFTIHGLWGFEKYDRDLPDCRTYGPTSNLDQNKNLCVSFTRAPEKVSLSLNKFSSAKVANA